MVLVISASVGTTLSKEAESPRRGLDEAGAEDAPGASGPPREQANGQAD